MSDDHLYELTIPELLELIKTASDVIEIKMMEKEGENYAYKRMDESCSN